ncbi:anaerobic ribonucleoside-triphosphate reductase [Anaerococcus tetradius]|uniref:anaerobic ribonucleoside-triphosphate reductase n=1 Tax=Anaerococcus tetradius TaxID=33036 RepID=UPI0023F13642|nr:anaerobic ribonucleoside-triphosphate reductase [Anaerococcus tetradius]
MLKVIKRDGSLSNFEKNKIVVAIEKAMNSPSGVFVSNQALEIANEIESEALNIDKISIYDIEDKVYYKLIDRNNPATAKSYESYKSVQAYKREINTSDDDILGLLNQTNIDVMDENSNKNPIIASTQRDLIAGEVAKDIAKRKLIPLDLVEAHESAAIHIHDLDYFIQPIFNCCLVDMKDMLDKGTVVNDKMIETPKSFQVACNVMTQIIAQIASNQYGGQSINISCLSPYLEKSYKKNLDLSKSILDDDNKAIEMAKALTQRDLESGIQTIQYQINTLMTSNGQSPFVTLFMHTDEKDPYLDNTVKIIEEILKQRIMGIKNEQGVYVTPAFPKLIYVLDENNIREDSKYYKLTELAAKCTAKRMYPDYISAKKMRENYEGNVFSPMGCRAFLPPYKDEFGNYKFDGRFNMGVATINLPQIGILANGDEDKFFEILDKRLDLIKRVGLLRYDHLSKVTSDSSPIHFRHGAIARLNRHQPIKPLLENGYATVTIGYIGIYEASILVTGKSHTSKIGHDFAIKIMKVLNDKKEEWSKKYGIAFAVYGTPAESLTHRFASIDKKRFGIIKDVTDKGFYTNSFHVDVREEISVFDKFDFESEFQQLSTGGCISYAEIPNMTNNIKAVLTMIKYIYDHIQYAEFNTKSDYCGECGFDGEILLDEDNNWYCPNCGNKDRNTLTVVRRTCGYLGENFWNEGRTKEIKARVVHI